MLEKLFRIGRKVLSAKMALIIWTLANGYIVQCSAEGEYGSFENNVPAWMIEQIQEDLAPFRDNGVKRKDLDKQMQVQEDLHLDLQLVRFRIANREIYISGFPPPHPNYQARVLPVARFLKKLALLVDLPEVEFIMTTHDELDGKELVAPVFAFAKNPKYAPHVILMPDFEALGGFRNELAEVERGNALFPWSKKIPLAFWRGAMTGGAYTIDNFLEYPRAKSISFSLEFPRLINSRFTALCQCERECPKIRAKYAPYFASFVSIDKQIAFKYQLLIDGNSCAYSRAYWQLFSNCVVLKQASDSIQWYYRALQPYVHYIPIKTDMSDLVDVVLWAIDHDAQAEAMSKEAQSFAHNNLTNFRIMQYLYLLLKEYAKLLI